MECASAAQRGLRGQEWIEWASWQGAGCCGERGCTLRTCQRGVEVEVKAVFGGQDTSFNGTRSAGALHTGSHGGRGRVFSGCTTAANPPCAPSSSAPPSLGFSGELPPAAGPPAREASSAEPSAPAAAALEAAEAGAGPKNWHSWPAVKLPCGRK